MGLLSGLLTAFGGYGQGVQAKRDYELRKQQVAQQQTQQDEQKRLDDLNIAHAQTVADQDKANTAFRTKLQLPKASIWDKYTDAQKTDYYQVRLTKALQAGDMDTVAATQNEINNLALSAQRYSQADYNSGARSALSYSQADYNTARAKAAATAQQTAIQIAGMNNAGKLAVATKDVIGRLNVATLQGRDRYAVAQLVAANLFKTHNMDDATRAAIAQYDQMYKGYLQETSTNAQVLGLPGATTAAPPSFPAINISFGAGGVPQFQPDPGGGGGGNVKPLPVGGAKPKTSLSWDAQKLQVLVTNMRAHKEQALPLLQQMVQAGQIDAATANQALRMAGLPPLPSGGSKVTLPFERVRYTNPTAQTDLPTTTPRMQAAFSVVAPFAPVVTSVAHGEHVKDSAHYAHRAVDVGAFGSTTVGYNAPTWQAIMYAIASGQFEKIGTIPEIVNNPMAQAWARAHGVLLFLDPGDGPHVHFQVSA